MKHFFYILFLAVVSIYSTTVVSHQAYAQVPDVSATPTSIQSGPTTLDVTLFLHGIGKAGDSVNQSPSGSTPLHPHRTVTITLYDAQKNLVATKEGNVVFDGASGSFKGSVVFDADCPTGTYSIEVNVDQYVKQTFSDQQIITTGTTTELPPIYLEAGDVNNDEYLDIVDYSMLIGCFSELMPAAACNATTKALGDINDDGAVNQFDYNLFLRELTQQAGK